jgi:hypothetical protein
MNLDLSLQTTAETLVCFVDCKKHGVSAFLPDTRQKSDYVAYVTFLQPSLLFQFNERGMPRPNSLDHKNEGHLRLIELQWIDLYIEKINSTVNVERLDCD